MRLSVEGDTEQEAREGTRGTENRDESRGGVTQSLEDENKVLGLDVVEKEGPGKERGGNVTGEEPDGEGLSQAATSPPSAGRLGRRLLPGAGGAGVALNGRAQSFAERLRLGIAVIHGEAQDAESDLVDGRHSPPTAKSVAAIHPSLEIPMLIPKEKPPITVVGDVGGRIAIIVDDIIDDVDSFLAAAETLKERGAYKIFVMATHGLLSSDAPRLIEESAIDEVVVTNTIPHEIQKLQCPKIKTVDISMILSEAIRRIHNGESMSYLFRNIGLDD
ncbi:hypothetical protein KIL84_014301 [Mauremys mutica]|uniref:Phosphoribosyl pyrophosphate synthase-associated protein 2 n=1 Tax=Mauremys mutica TaxID=74926 RepID=A0A9D3XR39_9SAUR|nr:hypothetical protein KIL84_014301 [Mauremys mutica]